MMSLLFVIGTAQLGDFFRTVNDDGDGSVIDTNDDSEWMELLRVFLSFLCCSIISLDLSSGGPVFSNGWDCCCATLEFSVCTHSIVPHHIIVIVNRAFLIPTLSPSNQWNWSRYFVCCCCFFSSFRLSHLSLMLYLFFFICCCARFFPIKIYFSCVLQILSRCFLLIVFICDIVFIFGTWLLAETRHDNNSSKRNSKKEFMTLWDMWLLRQSKKSNKKLTRARNDDSITGDEHEIAKFSWR